MKKQYSLHCPYCGAAARLTTCKEIYGADTDKPDRKAYVCCNFRKGCDSYVLAYKGSSIPMGSLANRELRKKRIIAHNLIDEIVGAGIMTKKQIYRFLEDELGVPRDTFHIGACGMYFCEKAIGLLNDVKQDI